MARRVMGISLLVAVAAAVMFAHNASAQSAGCTTAIISLAPCLGYITGNSSTPSSSCCTQLSSVVQAQAACLCSLLNGGGSSFGININQTQALALPGACKVQTPPVSQCKAGAPASSPAGSPATPATPTTPTTPATPATPTTPTTPGSSTPSTPATPSVPSVPAGTGSKTTPSTTRESSDAYRSSRSVFFSALFVVASASSLAIF